MDFFELFATERKMYHLNYIPPSASFIASLPTLGRRFCLVRGSTTSRDSGRLWALQDGPAEDFWVTQNQQERVPDRKKRVRIAETARASSLHKPHKIKRSKLQHFPQQTAVISPLTTEA